MTDIRRAIHAEIAQLTEHCADLAEQIGIANAEKARLSARLDRHYPRRRLLPAEKHPVPTPMPSV